MFNKLFGKPKAKSKDGKPSVKTVATAVSSMEKIGENLDMLEKKEQILQRKIAAELQKATEYSKAKNKRAAINCLKKKKLFEAQAEQLAAYQLRLHDQMILLEGAKATTDTVDALRSGAVAMKAIQKQTNIIDVDRTMEDISEQQDNMKQIQDALAAPVGVAADFDDDELEAELEELEGTDLDEQLHESMSNVSVHQQPFMSSPEASNPVPTPSVRTQPQKTPVHTRSEDDELAALQKEMAL
ncbi:charged multivesicular body protein 4A/B [Marchantia polymorpha subsp. ruderalis]|uniref:Uncharacterized protein n=2 Tax=Marchantia polymorpha TaxID=3197 RepID=A0A176VQR5_MARPO|nr:hypothetical protein AXG93_3271s1390 [Marchantia polymorpha subsp. ruderalis]PTQ48745.1 hypothetical protein MARPO_0004s0039 [Marchantia polymorpha]BBN05832.1 hypothetical protein Mp_3g16320 [Marchantia polymorpha subsp. ruderalis]|eukprot:PTQ48745.1 hypothetical protein MARPO_0004s0039 [Marchantia polymorpha]